MDPSLSKKSGINESEIDNKSEYLDNLQSQFNKRTMSLSSIFEEKDKLHLNFREETRKWQRVSLGDIKGVLAEEETLNSSCEALKKPFDSWTREFKKREALYDHQRQILDVEKNKHGGRKLALQLASTQQRKTNENVLSLVEKHQREKEKALKEIQELGPPEVKQKLNLEIQKFEAKLKQMKHPGNEDDATDPSKMKEINKEALANIQELGPQEANEDVELQNLEGEFQGMKNLGNEDDATTSTKSKEVMVYARKHICQIRKRPLLRGEASA